MMEASTVVTALQSLLFPLRWPGFVVPSLPQCASVTTGAMQTDPRPFMLGLDKVTAVRCVMLMTILDLRT